jgi:hypothetical protein
MFDAVLRGNDYCESAIRERLELAPDVDVLAHIQAIRVRLAKWGGRGYDWSYMVGKTGRIAQIWQGRDKTVQCIIKLDVPVQRHTNYPPQTHMNMVEVLRDAADLETYQIRDTDILGVIIDDKEPAV